MSMGEQEQEMPPNAQTLPFEGHSFELTRDENATKVVPKGDAKDVPKVTTKMMSIHETVEPLLPEGEVSKGDRWSLDGKKMQGWMERQAQGLKLKSVTGSVECTLKEIAREGTRRTAHVEYVLDLEATADPMALFGGAGEDGEEDEGEGAQAMKPKVDMTLRMKKAKGQYVFDIDAGSLLSSGMDANMEIELSGTMGEQEITGEGKGSIKSETTWKTQSPSKD
jgi:hypothetical protein